MAVRFAFSETDFRGNGFRRDKTLVTPSYFTAGKRVQFRSSRVTRIEALRRASNRETL
jgi:hypothetical protein